MIGLQTAIFGSTLEKSLKDGYLMQCAHICNRYLCNYGNVVDLVASLQSIPISVSADDFIHWVQHVVIPLTQLGDSNRNMVADDLCGVRAVEAILNHLCDRALETETRTNKPFDATLYVDLANRFLNMSTYTCAIDQAYKDRIVPTFSGGLISSYSIQSNS